MLIVFYLLVRKKVKIQKKRIPFFEIGWVKMIEVYEYIPRNNSNCYRNLLNPFRVTKNQRDLLVLARKVQKNSPIVVSLLHQDFQFDSNSNLNFWEGKYIIVNNLIRLPVEVKVIIKKNKGNYIITAEMDGYGYIGYNPTKEIGFIVSSETPSKAKNATKLKMNFNKHISYFIIFY